MIVCIIRIVNFFFSLKFLNKMINTVFSFFSFLYFMKNLLFAFLLLLVNLSNSDKSFSDFSLFYDAKTVSNVVIIGAKTNNHSKMYLMLMTFRNVLSNVFNGKL